MTERENLLTRILKRLGLIVEFEVSKEDMCKQAQSICNHDCEHCAWQTERSENEKANCDCTCDGDDAVAVGL